MATMDQEDFKFPDESESAPNKIKADAPYEIEIEDDTPPEDRNKTPMPKPLVEELEKDELDDYDDKVKTKFKQMRKVWHDERREKESALREQQEAISLAQRLLEENKRIKEILTTGEQEYISTAKNAAGMELEMAKRAYKEAYEAGDSDKLMEAQQAMQEANLKVLQARNFKLPPLQEVEIPVQQAPVQYQSQQAPTPDSKAVAWQERNSWFGQNRGMTAYALGVHEELREDGVELGSEDYYRALDRTMRKRFPETFQTSVVGDDEQKPQGSRARPSTVVAPAVRSTASNKVKLKQSQINLAKKLGLTPQQYVEAQLKLEAQNG
jgi:hypothetical protein